MGASGGGSSGTRRLALATGKHAVAGRGGTLLLPILPLATFYRAEDYRLGIPEAERQRMLKLTRAALAQRRR